MGSQGQQSIEGSHYIGIDVGTGSARACIVNHKGDIVGLASNEIALWQPEPGYYVSRLSARGSIRAYETRSADVFDVAWVRSNQQRTSGRTSAHRSNKH